jgi:hypothetical protein
VKQGSKIIKLFNYLKGLFEKNMAATYSPSPYWAGCSTTGPPTGGLTALFDMGRGSCNNFGKDEKQKSLSIMKSFFQKNMAATYSPVPLLAGCSTIGPPTGGLTDLSGMGRGSYTNFGKG